MFKKTKIVLVGALLSCSLIMSASAIDGIKGGDVQVASSLNLRGGSSTAAEVMASLPNGTDLCVIGEENGFYKVSAGGKVGFVSSEYVELHDIMDVENGGGAKVTASVLNLRSAPTTEAEVVGRLTDGAVASIVGINSGWLKVTYNGSTGYISPEYVEYVSHSQDGQASVSSNSAASSSGNRVVALAKQYLGTRYVYGGASPSGFDCSGFTSYVYKQFGIGINRTAAAQYSNGYKVSKSELQAGDLVFFATGGGGISHVGIYIGNGNFIHAVKPGKALTIDSLSSGYYTRTYVGARRVL